MLLSLSYEGAAKYADTLVIDVFVDGDLARSMTVSRAPNELRGEIEIQFADDYPSGKQLSVRVTGQRAGEIVSSAFADTLAAPSCSSLSLSLSERIAPTPGGPCLPMTCASSGETCGSHDDGCGSTLDCGACVVHAMSSPPIVPSGGKVTLEGRFTRDATVRFPGASATSVPSSARPHRLEVTVPVDATEGALTITAGGATLAPVPFRRATYALGVARADRYPTQSTFARRETTPARGATSAFTYGGFAYLVGGATQPLSGPVVAGSVIYRARINADGSLDAFAAITTSHLATAVYNHSTVLIGREVYVLGGMTAPGTAPTTLVQRATFDDDGVLREFVPVGDLTVPRRQADAIVLGRYLYIVGGNRDNQVLAEIERAPIHADGSLGTFTVDPAHLVTARGGHRVVAAANKLFVLGGDDGATAMTSIEVAEIAQDGSLSPFSTSTSTLTTARTDLVVARLGDALYAIGGRSDAVHETIERADLASDGNLAPFALEPTNLNRARFSAGIAWVGDTLQLLGGSEGGILGMPTLPEILQLRTAGNVDSFSAQAQASAPAARANACSVVIGDAIYLIGGADGSARSNEVLRAPLSSDGVPGTFVRVGTLLQARSHFACAISRSRLHVLGGFGGSIASPDRLRSTESAPIGDDGLVGAFEAGPDLMTSHVSASAVFLGNRLYVLGGGPSDEQWVEVSSAMTNDRLEAFAKARDVNDDVITLGRRAHGTLVLSGGIFILGGISTSAELATVARIPIIGSASLGAAAATPGVLSATRASFAAFTLGPSLYLTGGTPMDRPIERLTLAATGDLGASAAADNVTLSTNREGHRALVAGRRVIVVGGNIGGTEIAVAR